MCISNEGNGFPGIFMISRHESEREVRKLFEKLCQWNSCDPQIIMTDDFKIYSKLISEYYPQTSHLLCTWHIYRAWIRKLSKLYSKRMVQNIFYDLMKIQRILDIDQFELEYRQFLERCDPSLKMYFIANYDSRKEKWASCYRKYAGINVNMFNESLHRLLKRTYLKGNNCEFYFFTIIFN